MINLDGLEVLSLSARDEDRETRTKSRKHKCGYRMVKYIHTEYRMTIPSHCMDDFYKENIIDSMPNKNCTIEFDVVYPIKVSNWPHNLYAAIMWVSLLILACLAMWVLS